MRELDRNEDSNYFTQLSLFNTEKNNDERVTVNFGLGKDFLVMTNYTYWIKYIFRL